MKSVSIPVDFSPDSARELQQLGFNLPSTKISSPDFQLQDLHGSSRTLSSFRGKLVILNFWGAWCHYCVVEMPSLQRFYDRFKADGLEVVAVDVQDAPEEVRDFIQKNKYTFPVLLDKDEAVTGMYGIRGFPTTFLVDRAGFLRAALVGGLEWDKPEIAAVFKKLLASQ